jgi:hypothetical protein
MLHSPTKSLGQTTHDGHASLQAQLLERNYVEERLEQVCEARGTHATQSDNSHAQRAIDWHLKVKECGVDIKAEYPSQVRSDARGWLTTADAVVDVRNVDRAAVLELKQDGAVVNLEDSRVVTVLPNIYQVRRPALQHSHSRLQMKGSSRRQLYGKRSAHV